MRVTPHLAERYLTKSVGTMYGYAQRRGVSRETMRRRFGASRSALVRRTCRELPPLDEPLIAIADAMWHESEGVRCTTYFILLRPVRGTRAWILPPVTTPGTESWAGWHVAWEEVPASSMARIVALVCDGKRSLRVIGKRYGWRVQLCHFHLMALIKNYATGHAGTRWQERGRLILDTVTTIITTRDDAMLEKNLETLSWIIELVPHQFLKRNLVWFSRYIDLFRTYLDCPELNLPVTSNSAESLIRTVRDLLSRSRGFRSAHTLMQWMRTWCLIKKTICCRGKNQPH